MISGIPPGDPANTHIIGKSQGYLGLAVNFSQVIDETTGALTPCLRTLWMPTPKELEALNAGSGVVVELINITQHPPIMVNPSEVPD